MITDVKPQGGTWCVPTQSSLLSKGTLSSNTRDTVFYRWGAVHIVFKLLELLGQFPIAKTQAHREEERPSSYCRGRLTTSSPLVFHYFSSSFLPGCWQDCALHTTLPHFAYAYCICIMSSGPWELVLFSKLVLYLLSITCSSLKYWITFSMVVHLHGLHTWSSLKGYLSLTAENVVDVR